MAWRCWRSAGTTRTSACVAVLVAWFSCVSVQTLSAQTSSLTVFAPERQDYALALDELEVRFDDPRASQAFTLNLPAAATLAGGDSRAPILRATATDSGALVQIARDIEVRNAGVHVDLVLYEAGRSRSDVTRRVLTREVAVLFEPGADAASLIGVVTSARPRRLEGVEGAYVVEAMEPLDAIVLADSLRAMTDVKAAYPLLRARQFLR